MVSKLTKFTYVSPSKGIFSSMFVLVELMRNLKIVIQNIKKEIIKTSTSNIPVSVRV